MNNLSTQPIDDATEETRSIIEMIKQFATLSRILRIGGAFSVVASMSIFLLQGWDSGNDINRYYLLLSQTILLAAGGFGLAFLVRENKGARVFFGLSLVSIAANLTTLGALIFSYVQWGGSLSDYPDIALWSVSSGGAIIQALGIAAIVLIPITLFGFKIMARRSAMPLGGAYLLSSAMLLIPVRDTLSSSIIAGISVLLTLIFVTKLTKRDNSLRTMEGLFARLILFIAPVIVLARSLWLYQADALIFTIIASTAFMALRHSSLLLAGDNKYRKAMEIVSVPVAFAFAANATQLIDGLITVDYSLPVFAMVFAAPMLDLAKRSEAFKKGILQITGMVVSVSFLLHLAVFGNLFNGLICALIGIVVMVMGYVYKLRLMTMVGFITALSAVAYDVTEIFAVIDLFNWTSLAVAGVSAIIIGSIIERHGATLKLRFDNMVKDVEARMI